MVLLKFKGFLRPPWVTAGSKLCCNESLDEIGIYRVFMKDVYDTNVAGTHGEVSMY